MLHRAAPAPVPRAQLRVTTSLINLKINYDYDRAQRYLKPIGRDQLPRHRNGPRVAIAASSAADDATSPTPSPEAALPPPSPPQLPIAPWGLSTTLTVMMVWIVSFWVAAYSFVPAILAMMGANTHATTPWALALRHLTLDITQLGITLLLLSRALREYNPRSLGLFNISLHPLRSWVPVVAVGVATFPLVDWLHKLMVALTTGAGVASSGTGGGSMMGASSGWEARALWGIVLTLCAPIWEEIMFRGFLLPSLARRLPMDVALAASAIFFALVHFTREGFVPLVVLGLMFGAAYVRTGNLLPAILLHSLWNVYLLAQVMLGV